MARPAKFTESEILDAALEVIAESGPAAATMAAIADQAGAPTGSLYHRFSSRDALLARLWVRTVERFQEGFVAALAAADLDEAALGAARHALVWAREHLAEARVLVLFRREELAGRWPDEIGEELARLNGRVDEAVREHARRRYGADADGHLQRLRFVLVDLPYAASRRYLAAGMSPPVGLDELVADAARCLLPAGGASAAGDEGGSP